MRNKLLLRVILITTFALLLGISLSFTTVYKINIDASRESLQASSAFALAEIAQISDPEELNRFVEDHHNDFFRMSVIGDDMRVLADSYYGDLEEYDYSENKYALQAKDGNPTFKIAKIYRSEDEMLAYYERIPTAMAGREFLIVRVSTVVNFNNEPFWMSIVIGCCIWIAIVIIAYFVVDSSIKASIKPLVEVENLLESIGQGDFCKIRTAADQTYDHSEFGKLYRQIADMGNVISDNVQELRYEQRKSDVLLGSISQGIIALSQKGTVLMVNQVVTELFENDQIVGMPIDMLIEQEDALQVIENALLSHTYSVCTFTHKDVVYRIETVFPSQQWQNEMGKLEILVILTNITQEVHSASIRSEFFANASHELKTPLTAITGYSELMTMDGADEKQIKKCASEINANATKMKNLLDDMLRLSKLDANLDQEEITMVDLREIAEEAVKEQTIIAKNKQVGVIVEGEASMPGRRDGLKVMIVNLINNAIKYNRVGGSVRVTLSQTERSVSFSVSDTGIGIAPEAQGRLFERFYKVDTARRRTEESSTGLGLAIVKHIALEHGGVIKLDSTPDVGTTVTVTFELK